MADILTLSADWIPTVWKKLVEIRNRRENQIRELADVFGDPELLARYYVEPKCQHHNPADYNEVEAISFVKCPVFTTLKEFLKRELLVNDGRNQMFILGDAGMGKTSLLLMLKLTHLTSFWPKKYNCELLKLGPKTLDRIANIADKRNTTLLLDALDEDSEGFGRVKERLLELLTATSNFRRVIISCRTQYFPSGADDPFDRPGRIEVGGFVCPMIFLSLFDDEQVDEYLRKRFSKAEANKVKRSKAVIEKMETLRFRPLLLAHIEDIIDSQKRAWNEYTIYKALVEAWLLREEKKFRRLELGPIDAKSLWAACTAIALNMQSNDKRYLTNDELEELIQATPAIAHLKHFDVGGRSLLNRNSKGDYRFSHYTTQEFLIADAIAGRDMVVPQARIRATDQVIHFLSAMKLKRLPISYVDFTGYNLTKLQLSNAEATGAILAKVNLLDHDLSGANLSQADLRGAEIVGTSLRNARLHQALLNGARFFQAILDGADFSGADLSDCRIEKCSVRNIILKAKLDRAYLTGVRFQEIDFSRSSLNESDFSGQDLSGVNFDNASLVGANFLGCDLSNASFQGANLSKAILANANLSNANLTDAIIDNAVVTGARFANHGT
jgi:uncharacterized protein YjbI with pentapeptide repeats